MDLGKDGVSKIIAAEQHIAKTQVKDSYHYAKGIDAIRKNDPELADTIMNSEKKITKKTIQVIGQAKPGEQKAMIKALKDGDTIPQRTRMHDGASNQNREDRAKIRSIVV